MHLFTRRCPIRGTDTGCELRVVRLIWTGFRALIPSAAPEKSGQSSWRVEVLLTKGTCLFVTTKTTTLKTRTSKTTGSREKGSDDSKIFTLYVTQERKCSKVFKASLAMLMEEKKNRALL